MLDLPFPHHRLLSEIFVSAPQVLVEPIQRALPCLFSSGVIVPGGRVVMEAVIGAFVDVTFVRHVRLSEISIERWPPPGGAGVEFTVLCIYRRLDLGRLGSAGLSSIEWNRSPKI